MQGRVVFTFIGEDAVDTGGVTREFFFLAMQSSSDMKFVVAIQILLSGITYRP